MLAKTELRSRAEVALKSVAEAAASLTRLQIITITSLLVLLALGGVFTFFRARPSTVRVFNKNNATAPDRSAESLTVHVAGAVNCPGLYMLPETARVADALGKAGGPAPDALLENINLAARLKDGEKVMVPRRPAIQDAATGAGAAASSGASAADSALVNLNLAGAEELDKLPGVGPSLAKRIVEYREKNGQFSSVEELDDVQGIGPSKLESLRGLVTI